METAISVTLSKQRKGRIYKKECHDKATDIESLANAVVFLLLEKVESIIRTLLHIDSETI